ncbi:MAG: rod shape-determining protein RodA [Acidobacteria bacterium]|nr:rod shape-determining protein RodA [Acidobacteriota bacterium]
MRPTSAPLTLADNRPHLRHLAGVRWVLLVAALALAGLGLATVHSASSELSLDYLPRQAVWVGVGILALALTFSIDYQTLSKFSLPIYIVGLVILTAVLFLGTVRGGARSWFGFGSFGLQPSEFAKLSTAVLLARYLASTNRRYLRLRQIAIACGIAGLPMALVVLQRDMGSAMMFMPLLAGMLFVSGVRWQVVVAALVLALIGGAILWNFVMLDYQKTRVLTFLDPGREPLGAGYQLRQSKIAVGSGQVAGRGYMQGTQSQLRFLPARHTDFVFAVLAEEWGFLGVVGVLMLYATYILNGALVAVRARDRTGILLVVGLLGGFAFHVVYNTAMVVGLVPITGIPLPFLSYGGSFTLANFIAVGMILGVDFRRYVNR